MRKTASTDQLKAVLNVKLADFSLGVKLSEVIKLKYYRNSFAEIVSKMFIQRILSDL